MNKKKIPEFETEDQEREFWASHDSSSYIRWNPDEKIVLPNLKPSLQTISLSLPETLLNELKLLANKKGVSYQDLLKIFVAERVQKEFGRLSVRERIEK